VPAPIRFRQELTKFSFSESDLELVMLILL
jgi:hypothetical protein